LSGGRLRGWFPECQSARESALQNRAESPRSVSLSGRVKTVNHNHLRRLASRLGYEVHRAELGHTARRSRAMEIRGVDFVLDVGANAGQYAQALRGAGYRGRIASFEPLLEGFAQLQAAMGSDPLWSGRRVALGAEPGIANLNVLESDVLSSLLPPSKTLSSHIKAAAKVRTVAVPVATLDALWTELVPAGSRVLLKIDTQGFEHSVLDGAACSMPGVSLLEVEASLVQTYDGGSTIYDMLPRLRDQGFHLISIETGGGYVDAATGQVLDVNILAGRSA
jgi:FkbM family methyltransferase